MAEVEYIATKQFPVNYTGKAPSVAIEEMDRLLRREQGKLEQQIKERPPLEEPQDEVQKRLIEALHGREPDGKPSIRTGYILNSEKETITGKLSLQISGFFLSCPKYFPILEDDGFKTRCDDKAFLSAASDRVVEKLYEPEYPPKRPARIPNHRF